MGTSKKVIHVVFFNRKPRAMGNFSVESYFLQMQTHMPSHIKVTSLNVPFESNGLWRRIANALFCLFKQGDVNHITGDIHYVAAFLRKSKTVLTILDCGMLSQAQGLKFKLLKLLWFSVPIAKSKVITAISTATKTEVKKFTSCPDEKIKVVYVSVNDHYQRLEKEFNTDKPRILHVGTAANKNLANLIPALKGLQCLLVIVGKVPDVIKQLIEENDIEVELIETRLTDAEILNEYHKCDILSLVSTIEGFGMPIVEANGVGRVVITSNTTSMPEIAGNAAYIVDPFDCTAIRNGFDTLIADKQLRDNLIQNGYNNHKRFQPQSLAAQYAQVYEELSK